MRCNAFTSLETGLAGLNDDKREPLTAVTYCRRLGDACAERARDQLDGELSRLVRDVWRPRFARSAVVAAYGEMAKPPPLDRVHARTLLVRGADSSVMPEALIDVVRETLADCTVVTVPAVTP